MYTIIQNNIKYVHCNLTTGSLIFMLVRTLDRRQLNITDIDTQLKYFCFTFPYSRISFFVHYRVRILGRQQLNMMNIEY